MSGAPFFTVAVFFYNLKKQNIKYYILRPKQPFKLYIFRLFLDFRPLCVVKKGSY